MNSDRRPLKSRSWPVMHSLATALVRLGVSPNQISVAGMFFGLAAGVCLAMTAADGTSGVWMGRFGADMPPLPVVDPEFQNMATQHLTTSTSPPSIAFAPTPLGRVLFIAAAAFIQLRLLCNLIDGMVAIEGGRQTRVGVLYNELPDRISDVATLIGAGYAAMSEPVLGWIAALIAVMTAYIRAVGKSEGTGNDFCGPMAKPHRMAVMTAACVASACWPSAWFGTFPKHVLLWSGTSGISQGEQVTTSLSVLTIALAVIALGGAATCIRRTLRIAISLNDGPTQPT